MMSPETPQQAEERLQRYAKERRAQGGDFALHPATRRLLQDAARRQHGTAAPVPSRWFGLWQGWLTMGGGVAAAILFAIWMFQDSQPGEQTVQLARNDAPGNQPRTPGAEWRGDEIRDEAKKVIAEASLSKAKQKSGEAESRPQAVSGVVTPGSLTPALNTADDKAGAYYSLNGDIVPAQTLYAPGAAPVSLQNQPGPPPTILSAGQLSYQNAGAPADPRGLTPQSGADEMTRARRPADTLSFFDTGAPIPKLLGGNEPSAGPDTQARRLNGLAEADKNQNASQSSRLMNAAAPGQAGQNQRLNNNGPLPGVAAAKDDGAIVPPAAAPQPGLARAEARFREPLEIQVVPVAPPVPGSQAKANAPDFYQRVEAESLTGDGTGQFGKLPPPPGAPASRATVLNDFTVEQQGDSLRLIDADGSVYEGTIDTTNALTDLDSRADRSGLKKETVREPVAKPEAGVDRQYFFRATGSNVTLRQRVLVNGQWSAPEELMSAAGRGSAAERATLTRFKTTGGAGVSTNRLSTIEGTVQVGTTNAQPFRAVRAPRP